MNIKTGNEEKLLYIFLIPGRIVFYLNGQSFSELDHGLQAQYQDYLRK